MRTLLTALTALMLFTGWAAPVWAQAGFPSAELMKAYNRQNELREQGRYGEAEPQFRFSQTLKQQPTASSCEQIT